MESPNPTLLVLAAGMGSRYGGLKQLDPVGPSGETLLDYSVYDAIRSGFDRVVFVIRRDFEADFRDKVGSRYEDRIDVGYVFQSLNELPGDHVVPEERVKPWGTAHAIWCARDAVDHPFLAINADDFYGWPAVRGVGEFLQRSDVAGTDYCMAGYRLSATLSAHGTVSRGVCDVSSGGLLTGVREFPSIARVGDRILSGDNELPEDASVSLNCWGFTPMIFGGLETLFEEFLERHGADPKAEFYIPSAVESLVRSGEATVRVLPVESPWFGVTYREDRPAVVAALADLVREGLYPSLTAEGSDRP